MIRFTTESGATYVVDTEKRRLMRETGPHSPGIDYGVAPDAEWHEYLGLDPVLTPGYSAAFALANGKFRITTPVVDVTQVTTS